MYANNWFWKKSFLLVNAFSWNTEMEMIEVNKIWRFVTNLILYVQVESLYTIPTAPFMTLLEYV